MEGFFPRQSSTTLLDRSCNPCGVPKATQAGALMPHMRHVIMKETPLPQASKTQKVRNEFFQRPGQVCFIFKIKSNTIVGGKALCSTDLSHWYAPLSFRHRCSCAVGITCLFSGISITIVTHAFYRLFVFHLWNGLLFL